MAEETPPPPPLPLWEVIEEAIATKLATVTAANGYAVGVTAVVRPGHTRGGSPSDHQACLLQGEPKIAGRLPGNPPVIEWELPIQIGLAVAASPDGADPVDKVINVFAAAVNAAMLADPQWKSGSPAAALATNTRFAGLTYPLPEVGIEGVTLHYIVECRTAEDDWTLQIA